MRRWSVRGRKEVDSEGEGEGGRRWTVRVGGGGREEVDSEGGRG